MTEMIEVTDENRARLTILHVPSQGVGEHKMDGWKKQVRSFPKGRTMQPY